MIGILSKYRQHTRSFIPPSAAHHLIQSNQLHQFADRISYVLLSMISLYLAFEKQPYLILQQSFMGDLLKWPRFCWIFVEH